ncbi:hypothetical protein M0R45_017467 [Rubus argutus]|uniref:Uncharacterized protein n=1 Tax=Rubus argutus TaxID=59490 RepID=A0AAW1XX57_RUBAR
MAATSTAVVVWAGIGDGVGELLAARVGQGSREGTAAMRRGWARGQTDWARENRFGAAAGLTPVMATRAKDGGGEKTVRAAHGQSRCGNELGRAQRRRGTRESNSESTTTLGSRRW